MSSPAPPIPTQVPHRLRQPPDEDFWLRELGFARFSRMGSLLAEAAQVEKRVKDVYVGKAREYATALVSAAGADAATVRQHLLLVADYIDELKTAAIIDAGRATVGDDGVEAFREGRTRWARLPLALLSYLADPRALLSVAMCDRWHALGRCVMRAKGRVPKGDVLTEQRVREAAEAGLTAWRGARLARRNVALVQVFERGPDEVLVGFRRPYNLSSLLDEQGDRLVGHTEEWVILRFCDGGHRVDVTAKRLPEAVELATAVGSRLLGADVRYEKRRDPVTEEVLDKFLARLCHPDAEDLRLVEIKAEMPGEPGRPVKTVSGSGHDGIEHTVMREAERTAFAEDWRTVHHVKVWYERYRFTIHFPTPGETPLDLSYSDLGRDKGVAEAFEAFIEALRDELGAAITVRPRSEDPDGGKTARRAKKPADERVPARLVLAHWRRLLGEVIDDPAAWEMLRLDKFRRDGLLRWRTAWFFRCGDVRSDRFAMRAGARTLGCSGQVEWENEGNADDPYADLPDKEIECPDCGERWRIGTYRPLLHRRLRLGIDHEKAWKSILAVLGKGVSDLAEEAAGIASGLRGGERVYLAYLPLVTPAAARSRTKGHSVLWLGRVADPLFLAVGSVTCDLAQLHTGRATWEALLDDAVTSTPGAGPTGTPRGARPVAAAGRGRRAGAPRAAGPPGHGLISKVGRKIRFFAYATPADLAGRKAAREWDVLLGQAHGCRLFLALLADFAAGDDASGGERRFRTIDAVKTAHAALRFAVDAEDFTRWADRAREGFDGVAPGVGDVVVETSGGKGAGRGYRLGRRYAVEGLQLGEEIQIWKAHRKKGPPR